MWYHYDGNGNIIEERAGGHSPEGIQASGIITKKGEVKVLNRGIGLVRNKPEETEAYKRTYLWDEENRLKTTNDPGGKVEYRYDSTGMRTNKYSSDGESLYFNNMWFMKEDYPGFRQGKNIYLGKTRIATRLNLEDEPSTGYEEVNTYYYHGDHLGSGNIVTDFSGEVFEHIEYTPYGETWIEKSDDQTNKLPYRFTAKELDTETGLYYYGARYLNPGTSKWVSADPAGSELINPAQKGFSISGINWYAYANNNPVMYVDPTGLDDLHVNYDRIEKEVSFTFVPRTQSGGIDEDNIQRGSFKAANNVRNEQNGLRNHPNVPTMPSGGNYYPRNFPQGKANIKGHSEQPYGPTIFTDAKQVVPVYDNNEKQTGMTLDIGYNLHGGDTSRNVLGKNNIEDTTLGCIRGNNAGVRGLFPFIDKAKLTGGSAILSVPERTLKYNGQNKLSGM